MNISLTPELEKLVNEKVASGMYHSASEVIRAGLRLLKEQEELKRIRLDDLRRDILIGIDQVKNQEVAPLDTAAIKAKGRKLLGQKTKHPNA